VRIFRSLSVPVLFLLSLAGTLAAQTLSVSTTSLTFSSALGGASQQQTFNVTSSGASLTFAVGSNASWLSANPTTGSTPSTVTVTANPASLAGGTYTGTLFVNSATNSVSVQVTLVVSAVGASPSSLSFSYQLGGTLPVGQTINLTGSPTTFTAVSSVNWLTVTSSGNAPGSIAVALNTAVGSLAVGSYNASVVITPASGATISIPVTLTVTAEPTVTASSSAVSFDFQTGGANNVVSQTITLSVGGTQAQSYSINSSVNPNPSGQNWILVNPSSGTIPAGGSTQVTISYNTLDSITTPGTYTGALAIATPTAVAPANIPVSLLVSSSPLLSVPSNTLSFLYEVSGATPAAQSVTAVSTNVAASSTTGQLPIAISAATTSGNGWLTVTPTATQTGTPFSVSANPSGLAVGTYSGTITVTATGAGNGPQTIPVTLTVANDPVPLVTPSALTFVYEISKSQPGSQNLSVTSSTGGSLNYSATAASTQCGGAWLTLSGNASGTVSGTTVGGFTGSVNTTGVAAGSCAGTITVTATNATTGAAAPGSPVTIPVTLWVSANPLLMTSAPSLSFTAQQQGSAPPAQTITLSSTDSSAVLTYTVDVGYSAGSGWMSVNQTTGSTAAGANALTVSVIPGLLSAGTYSGTITLKASGAATVANSPVVIPVTFQVTSATLSATPTSLALTATAGGSAPASQSLQITTNGSVANFTAVASIVQSAASIPSWLTVTPTTGTTPATLTVSASIANLAAGTYSGAVTVSAANAAPVNVPVTLTVNGGSISASPTSLSFTEAAGTPTAATQAMTVTTSPSSLTYTVSVTMASGASANWLSASATGGTVTVSASSAALTAGSYTGSVILTASGATGSPITIPVTLTVVPPQSLAITPASLTFSYVLGTSAPAAQTATLTSSGGAAPFTVSTKTADGGTWLQVTPTSGTTPAALSVSIVTTGLAAGNYSGTITLASTSSTQTATVTVSMTVAAVPTPTIGGVANAGSYATGSVAPGENIVIFGTGIGPATLTGLQLTSTGSVATTVSNTQVTFDGTPAPIIYVSATQTSVMVPFEIGGRPTTVVQVTYQGVKSAPLTYNVSTATPGIYTQNSQGSGPGSILNQNYTVNGPNQPASAGSYVAVYLSGTGNTAPAGVTGAVIPSSGTGLKNIALPVTATVGGVPAPVAYAGSAPGDVEGIMQVNLQIPSGLTAGAQPIVITLGSGSTTYSTQTGVTVQVH
jgi:uncharacterized protein (TIGR03437 family)